MQLSKKSYKPEYKKEEPQEYKKAPPVDWNIWTPDYDKEIPHGKYQYATLGYVKRTDDWYMNWMYENNILGAWGLVKLRNPLEKKGKKYDKLTTAEGVWIDIIIVDEPTSSWESIEDYVIQESKRLAEL